MLLLFCLLLLLLLLPLLLLLLFFARADGKQNPNTQLRRYMGCVSLIDFGQNFHGCGDFNEICTEWNCSWFVQLFLVESQQHPYIEKNKPFEGISSYGWLAIMFVVFFISNILGLRYWSIVSLPAIDNQP